MCSSLETKLAMLRSKIRMILTSRARSGIERVDDAKDRFQGAARNPSLERHRSDINDSGASGL